MRSDPICSRTGFLPLRTDNCWMTLFAKACAARRFDVGRRGEVMNQLERVQRSLQKKSVPHFEIGDTVRVHVKVIEGEKERIQVYEGTVIARKGSLNTETVTVLKLSYVVGIERIFPF